MKLLDRLRRQTPPEVPTVSITGALLDEVKALKPGQAIKLSGRDGHHIAVLDWEDFEYIAERASMQAANQNGPL